MGISDSVVEGGKSVGWDVWRKEGKEDEEDGEADILPGVIAELRGNLGRLIEERAIRVLGRIL